MSDAIVPTGEPLGSFVSDGDTSGKPGAPDSTKGAIGNEGGSSGGESYAGYDTYDPLTIPVDSYTGSSEPAESIITGEPDIPRRRGRKPGTRNRPRGAASEETAAHSNLISLAGILMIGCEGISILTKIPEFEIDEADAKRVDTAVKKLAAQYAAVFDPKKVAWAELVSTLGVLAVPRIMAYRIRTAGNKPAPKPVAVMPGPGPQPQRAAANGAPPVPAKPINETSPSEVWYEQPAPDGAWS